MRPKNKKKDECQNKTRKSIHQKQETKEKGQEEARKQAITLGHLGGTRRI